MRKKSQKNRKTDRQIKSQNYCEIVNPSIEMHRKLSSKETKRAKKNNN